MLLAVFKVYLAVLMMLPIERQQLSLCQVTDSQAIGKCRWS